MEQEDLLGGITGLFASPSGAGVNGFQAYESDLDLTDDEEYTSLYSGVKQSVKMPIPTEENEEEPIKTPKKKTPKKAEIIEEEEEDEEEAEQPKRKPGRPKKNEPVEEEEEESEEEAGEASEEETEQISLLFNAVAEGLGIELEEDEEAPSDAEGLVDYFINLIQDESVPTYASSEVQKIDEFVRNGGNLSDYFYSGSSVELDLDKIDLSVDSTQRRIVHDFLLEKGFTEQQISKKISKYVDAEILEDEANDALESLKEIKESKKEQLLENQKKQKDALAQQQQSFIDGVVTGIKGLDNVRGIPVPKKDKETLLAFILKTDAEGKTAFQKKYAEKPIDNLLYIAYSLMKGEALTETAQKMGKTSAMKALKQSLNSTGAGRSSKRMKGSSDNQLFSQATQIFRQLN